MSIRRLRLFQAVRMASIVLDIVIFAAGGLQAQTQRNVILLIGDGMGPEHVKAASHFVAGKEGALFLESLPKKAEVVTCPAYAAPADTSIAPPVPVADSASAGTALATGRKVLKGVISVDIPGDGNPLPTALEAFAKDGKGTGLVTSSYLLDATPAAFGAHARSRTLIKVIAADYLKLRPNVLLGGGTKGLLTAAEGKAAGYQVATDRASLAALKPAAGGRTLGLFGVGPMPYEHLYQIGARKDYDSLPHLSEMAAAALRLLAAEPKGFFLMIEGGCIDKAAHANDLPGDVAETVEFDKTVRLVCQWAAKRTDTLIIVTADHETGGLKVVRGSGKGQLPEVTWMHGHHTGANVPLFASGPGSEKVQGTLDNTDVFRLMMGTFTAPTVYQPRIADPAEPVPADPSGD